MKKSFLLLLVVLISIYIGYSQEVIKYRTTDFTFKLTEGDGPFNWEKNKPTSLVVVISAKRTVIYTEIVQTYDFINETSSHYTTDTSIDSSWKVIDQNGKPCILQLQADKGKTLLFIFYDHIQICYNLMKL